MSVGGDQSWITGFHGDKRAPGVGSTSGMPAGYGGNRPTVGPTGSPIGGGASGMPAFGGQNINDWSAGMLTGAGAATDAAGRALARPQTIAQGMSAYTNPYTNQVINNSMFDLNRMNQIQQGQNAASAVNAGAFGGGRHGVVEAMTNAESQRAMGDLSSQLRHQGFNTAAGLAGQDIVHNQNRASGLLNVANQSGALGQAGYGLGRQAAQDQMQAGTLQQQLAQAVLGGAAGQFDQVANQPHNMLQTVLAAMGMNPMTNATTTTSNYTPGTFDYIGLAAQLGGKWLGRPT